MTKSLDQPGNQHAKTNDNIGKPDAPHRAAQAQQDAKVADLAQRTIAAASGGVPDTIKQGN